MKSVFMQFKWYRHLNIIAAVFIGIGGIGLNTGERTPLRYYTCIASLAIGIIFFIILLIQKQREGA